ncbi:MAG: hypothetical protein P8173_13300 [Gammaproteobacteria bacterium]|jgi:DNA-directed RNA polymerase specialized sigma24 family protein
MGHLGHDLKNKLVRGVISMPPIELRGESSLVTTTPPRKYLDAAEFRAALHALEPADLLRLRKKSAYRAAGTGMNGDDLLHEAILSTLDEGGRNCPADVSITVYLDNAMRSIASGAREKYARETPAGNGHNEEGPLGNHADKRPAPAEATATLIELEDVINRLEDLFADDPQAQAIVIGDMEGWSAEEIKEAEPMDKVQYATARRRVRRAIEREFGGEKRHEQ